MKILSLFSGIGAFEKALTNLNIPFDLVYYSEICKYASKAYSILHNQPESKNLGDVRNIYLEDTLNIDLLTHGSPCTNFSNAGLRNGGKKGSNTESSLLWESVRIIKQVKPKIVIWENVPNVLFKNNVDVFSEYLYELYTLGYTNTYEILNSLDFGIPQSRRRIFVISCLDRKYEFKPYRKVNSKLRDFIDLDSKYIITSKLLSKYQAKFNTNLGFLDYLNNYKHPKKLDLYGYQSRDYLFDLDSYIHTLTVRSLFEKTSYKYLYDNQVFTVSPKMAFNLMGFTNYDYYKINNKFSDSQLYKFAGNSIVVPVLEYIFKNYEFNI